MCLTSVDLKLFKEQYDPKNIEYMGGWKFKSTVGLFKVYIDKWIAIKNEASLTKNKALRTLAKLMLNALYGKFALNPNVQSKIPYLENGKVRYRLGPKETRDPIYIPMGSFITAYAREKTIRSAQSVYERFVYADTDSLHLEGYDIPENLEIDPTKLGAWKIEGKFTRAKYLRAKCYIEDVISTEKEMKEYLEKNPELAHHVNQELGTILNITCAGMPSNCYPNVTWDNFTIGSSFDGKLSPVHVEGGIVLNPIDFTLKK